MKYYLLSDELTYDEILRIISEGRKLKRILDEDGRISKKKMLMILDLIEYDILDLKRKCESNV